MGGPKCADGNDPVSVGKGKGRRGRRCADKSRPKCSEVTENPTPKCEDGSTPVKPEPLCASGRPKCEDGSRLQCEKKPKRPRGGKCQDGSKPTCKDGETPKCSDGSDPKERKVCPKPSL